METEILIDLILERAEGRFLTIRLRDRVEQASNKRNGSLERACEVRINQRIR